MVQASDVEGSEIVLARRENPALAPYWYSRPRWVWAPLPDNPEEAAKIVNSTVFGSGQDVIDMPRYFKPWEQGLPKLRDQLARLDDIKYLSKAQKESLRTRMSEQGLVADERNALILWGGSRRLLAMFDPATLRIRAILNPD